MTFTSILKILISMAPFWQEPVTETTVERVARLAIVAHAIDDAHLTREQVAALLTLGEFESHFALYIGAGRCLTGPYKCDVYRGVNRARTYWQLWRQTCPVAWSSVEGSAPELRASVVCASDKWSLGFERCKNGALGAFSGYAGDSCNWKPAEKRVLRYNEILAKL